MDDAMERLRIAALKSEVLMRAPMKVFAIARHEGWDDVVRAAARRLLSIRVREQGVVEEMRMVSGLDYQLFLDYFWRCSDAVVKFLESVESEIPVSLFPPGSVARTAFAAKYGSCPSCKLLLHSIGHSDPDFGWYGHPWFKNVMRNARDRLRNRPGMGLVDPDLVEYAVYMASKECATQKHVSVRGLLEALDIEVQRIVDGVSRFSILTVNANGV